MKIKLLFALSAAIALLPKASARFQYLQTKQAPVSDNYFGVKIKGNYRWIENRYDTIVKEWFRAQGNIAKAKHDPGHFAKNKKIIFKNLTDTTSCAVKQFSHPDFRLNNSARELSPSENEEQKLLFHD